MKKLVAVILFVVMLIAIGMIFKTKILLSFSNFLIQQDEPQKADAMVILSGNAFERGNEAYELFRKGFAPKIICPGGNLQPDFLILGDSVYESDLTKKQITNKNIADSLVFAIHSGTSTAEEADTVLKYCLQKNIKSIIVVTTLFHTRRAGKVYHKLFDKAGIKVFVRGANNFFFNEKNTFFLCF